MEKDERATRAERTYHSRLLSTRPARPISPPTSQPGASTKTTAQSPALSALSAVVDVSVQAGAENSSSIPSMADDDDEHEMCWHCSKAAAQLQVIKDHLSELHDHSSTWQGQASAEKERILARQHGSALKTYSGAAHKHHVPAATAHRPPSLQESHRRSEVSNKSREAPEPCKKDGSEVDGSNTAHPAELIPAVLAVAARITAEHAVAGPLRKQYQERLEAEIAELRARCAANAETTTSKASTTFLIAVRDHLISGDDAGGLDTDIGSDTPKIGSREPRTVHDVPEEMHGMDGSTRQLRQRLLVSEAAQAVAATEISRLTAANEELIIAKRAMMADIQFDADTEGLQAEKRRLEERLVKRDSMLLEQHNRIVLLESAVASVKEERNSYVQSLDEQSGTRLQKGTRFAAAKKQGGRAGGTLSSIRQALDDGAARLRRTVDELGVVASHGAASKDGKEMAYQHRIADLEAQCEAAITELHRDKLTRGNHELLSAQLVELHAELDALQQALAREHATLDLT